MPKKQRFSLILLLFFFGVIQSSLGQLYFGNNREFVFVDEANLRENPTVNSNVIGTLKQGTELMICSKNEVLDTINGIIAYWRPILNEGVSGYVWENTLSTGTFIHSNGNRLLLKNDSNGVTFKVFSGDSLINKGSYPDKPYEQYSYFHEIQPLFAIQKNLYFKLGDSDLMYSFDGLNVFNAGKCDKENVNSMHFSSQKEIEHTYSSIINRDKVNLRNEPNLNAKIIAALPKYTFVEKIGKQKKVETINNEENYWYKVKWKGKIGYVWGASISNSKSQIEDNDDKNTSYLLCNNALFVVYKGEIISHCPLDLSIYDETLHSFGDLGFGKGYDFVAIESMAESCGEYGGDNYYLWDGKKLNYFCSDGGVGDGGMSYGEEYVFPSEQNGIPNSVIKNSYSTEIIDIIPVDDCEEKYNIVTDNNTYSILQYENDSLVEMPSKYYNLKELIQREFPKYKLVQYEFGDINSDKIEDALFQIRMDNFTIDENGNEIYSYKSKIGIACGNTDGKIRIIEMNDHLLDEKEDSRATIVLKDSSITITTYTKLDPEDSQSYVGFGRKIYSFLYHSEDQKIYWESISIVNKGGLNKLFFKTKKVLFKDTWNFNDNFSEEK